MTTRSWIATAILFASVVIFIGALKTGSKDLAGALFLFNPVVAYLVGASYQRPQPQEIVGWAIPISDSEWEQLELMEAEENGIPVVIRNR